MSMKDLAPANVRGISPYVPGKPISETARELGLKEADILKMASNENPLGSSPKAIAALRGALETLAYYPDGAGFDLKAVISRVFGVKPENLVLGNGSNDVLELSARSFLTRDDSVVFARHAFMVYPLVTQAIGARSIEVPTRGFETDIDALVAAVRPDTKMLFVANPNNPTGTFTPWNDLRSLLERVSPRVLVVLDEAYGEYLPPELRSPALEWIARFPNLIVSRTLSKAYGLAGLRVGFAIAHPEVAELMNRVRQPFNVNQLAMVAACAALEDFDFIEKSRSVNAAGLVQIGAGVARLGLEVIPSRTNFITIRVGAAAKIYERLLAAGVIVRPLAGYGMPEHLRVTVGTAEQNARFLASLEAALAAP
ncbi:histidinol-phosphate transaminase [Usitatibacter palustris]|uniref:Histidinol-phosphate aminotransferase n=1 Tax=Usitatibacter palustris TaxID=2732487 RepID=A0A6M4HC28_9PROT|nr:histidinol-phosphate transaminase [Usitatibacter palustris]QJR15547.1 Histidinol-phosphate aminotransferase [Usitatibacter palustris]